MEEVNPLLIPTIVSESKSSNNKRGRPTIEETIKFSAQPKSLIISQILSKRAISCNVDKDQHLTQPESEDNILDLADSPQPTEQTLLNENINNIEIGRCGAINEEKDHTDTNSHLNDKLHYCNYPNCAYTCKLSCNLIKHKRTHTDEKPYLCDQCTFRSNFVNSLKVHKRIHTSERPHGCKHCTYRCNSSSNLKKHYLHRHPEVSKT